MKPITNTVDELFQPRELAEDEYLNKADGLIYCSKCHTPRQHRIELKERVFLPTVRCRCQQEIYDNEEAERKHQEFLMQVSHLRANGLQDKSLHDYNFANDKGIPVLMTNFSRILNTLTGMYSDDRNQFIDSFNKYSLLIIDDLGIERSSEFALEQVFNVIDSRYRSKKPLIVTTNLTLDELKHPKDLARARIYDRVLERCVPLKINNQNIRELNAAANMQEARKILNSGT